MKARQRIVEGRVEIRADCNVVFCHLAGEGTSSNIRTPWGGKTSVVLLRRGLKARTEAVKTVGRGAEWPLITENQLLHFVHRRGGNLVDLRAVGAPGVGQKSGTDLHKNLHGRIRTTIEYNGVKGFRIDGLRHQLRAVSGISKERIQAQHIFKQGANPVVIGIGGVAPQGVFKLGYVDVNRIELGVDLRLGNEGNQEGKSENAQRKLCF